MDLFVSKKKKFILWNVGKGNRKEQENQSKDKNLR